MSALTTARTPRRARQLPTGWVLHVALLLVLAVVLLPVCLLLMNSVKTDIEIKAGPLVAPTQIQIANYYRAWVVADFSRAFLNSLVIAGSAILGVAFLTGLSAYGLTRLRLPGADAVITYYLLAMTIPAPLFLVPLFFLWARLGLINTLPGLVLVYLALYQPFSIFLLRSYLLGLPQELEDAARVDGCTELQVFVNVVAPLAKPVFLTLAVLVGTWTWREFLFAVTFIHKWDLMTVALRYARFSGQYDIDFALQSAAGVIVILPLMLLYLFLQRTFVQGIISGGLK